MFLILIVFFPTECNFFVGGQYLRHKPLPMSQIIFNQVVINSPEKSHCVVFSVLHD